MPNDFELLYERTASVKHSQATLSSAKYVDHRTGEIHVVYRDAAVGAVAEDDLITERVGAVEATLSPLERKADEELLTAVADKTAAGDGDGPVSMGVWLEVDVAAAEQAVIDRHPELVWDGGRPLVDDLETARAIRAELPRPEPMPAPRRSSSFGSMPRRSAPASATPRRMLRWSTSIFRRIASMTWPPCPASRASGSSGHG